MFCISLTRNLSWSSCKVNYSTKFSLSWWPSDAIFLTCTVIYSLLFSLLLLFTAPKFENSVIWIWNWYAKCCQKCLWEWSIWVRWAQDWIQLFYMESQDFVCITHITWWTTNTHVLQVVMHSIECNNVCADVNITRLNVKK